MVVVVVEIQYVSTAIEKTNAYTDYCEGVWGVLLTSLVYEKRPEMDRAVQIRYPPRTVV